jgi:hypothetical protein
LLKFSGIELIGMLHIQLHEMLVIECEIVIRNDTKRGQKMGAPDYEAYHKSLTDELFAIKDRIRHLVKHWPTDGESKEVALRSLLRKLLPETVIIGRGFIVADSRSSSQIDILIVDARKPTLFRDGDLLIVTPDAVLAVIEVKTGLQGSRKFGDVLTKLSKIEKLCHDVTGQDKVWSGLFVFEDATNLEDRQRQALEGLKSTYNNTERIVNCISCGKTIFIRYWNRGAEVNSFEMGRVWHSYELEKVAPSYFVGNLIDWISNIDNSTVSYAWFPAIGGKERFRKYYLSPEHENIESFDQ